jgi:hypothetical protein
LASLEADDAAFGNDDVIQNSDPEHLAALNEPAGDREILF